MLGPYSDHGGRKLILLLPISGQLIRAGFATVVAHFELPFQLLIVGSVMEGLTGMYMLKLP